MTSKEPKEEGALERLQAALQDLKGALPAAAAGAEEPLAVAVAEFDDLRKERERHRALAEISGVVNSSLDVTTVLNEVMDTIVRLTGAERGFLMLRNQEGKLDFRIARNMDRESLARSEFALSRTVVERVARSGEAVVTSDAQEDPRFEKQESVRALNLRSIVCVPLAVRGKLTGVIYVDSRAHAGLFGEGQRDLLLVFANQAAVALENARLFEEVRDSLAEARRLQTLQENVFASMTSGVITTDVDDRVSLFNRAAEEILHVPASAALGKRYDQLLPSNSFQRSWTERFEDVKTAGKVLSYEICPAVPGRGDVDLNVSLAPLKDQASETQGVAIVLDDQTERKRLRRKFDLFQRMVSPAVIERLNPEELRLGGDRQLVSCLFADIRGFTAFSERMDPVRLLDVLNRYLGAAAEAVLREEGTLDKFLGDAVMAIFNAPEQQEDHALRAVRAAAGVRDGIQALHGKAPAEERLSFGIGVHVGEAVVGLVGTELRLDYTAIGDTVNTAKRIQENAARGQVLLSGTFHELVADHVEAVEREPLRVKGREAAVPVFELIGMRS